MKRTDILIPIIHVTLVWLKYILLIEKELVRIDKNYP